MCEYNVSYKLLFDLDPDVRILGSDWKGKPFTGYNLPIEIYFHERKHDYSTSALRKKIYQEEVNNGWNKISRRWFGYNK